MSVNYDITVKTGNVDFAGTDANVKLIIKGDKGQTDLIDLKTPKPNDKGKVNNPFEKNQVDEFSVAAKDIGKIKTIIISHDGKGLNSGWYLEYIHIKKEKETTKKIFQAGRWLDERKDDKKTSIELSPVEETKHKYESTPINQTPKIDRNTPGADKKSPVVDNKKTPSLDKKTPTLDKKTPTLDSKTPSLEKKSPPNDSKTPVIDKKTPALDSKTPSLDKKTPAPDKKSPVLDNKTPEKPKSGTQEKSKLNTSEGQKSPEKSKSNQATPEKSKSNQATPEKSKEVEKPKSTIPNKPKTEENKPSEASKPKPQPLEKSKSFHHEKPKTEKNDYGTAKSATDKNRTQNVKADTEAINRYIIKVKTGYIRNAGTDSNIYITIYGSKGTIEKEHLNPLSTIKGAVFQKGQTDEFKIKHKDIGQIKKINIGHDSDGVVKGWYLDTVKISCGDSTYLFIAKRWLDLQEGDGKTWIDINDQFDQETKNFCSKTDEPKIEEKNSKYHVIIKTGSDSKDAADRKVLLTIHGKRDLSISKTLDKEASINKDEELFTKDSINEFIFEEKDVKSISFIDIGHNHYNAWFIEYIKIQVDDNTTYVFNTDRWLNKKDNTDTISLKPSSKMSKKIVDRVGTSQKPIRISLEKFTLAELKRLKETLQDESSKIQFPRRKEHQPFVFNDLFPYYDIKQCQSFIESPPDDIPIGYFNRMTAVGVVEPWIAHRMENSIVTTMQQKSAPKKADRTSSSLSQLANKLAGAKPKIEYEGTTLTPRFPKISMKKPKNMNGPFYVDDVEEIREQLKKNFGAESVARQKEDKNRTVNDFYRMKLDQLHPISKPHMLQVYHAYLENTVGSKKALQELLKAEESNNSGASNTFSRSRKSKSAVEA